ncbi:hypothetical protein AK812_SmicGene14501 [Symbiodinium microadriaticum]|uniref:Uncharacterized protein n=1 Tax=Symbiodinium microadriaticum TaxID=2951 RepID=A0A1Q9E5D6_SYMMI|nr:hypothetical protein AK812_SmicGene14501 [Symbiodinium microadriaticum]
MEGPEDLVFAALKLSAASVLQRHCLRVTHRAGGLLAPHCPRRFRASSTARSFVTLVWTTKLHREAFLALLLSRWMQDLREAVCSPPDGLACWPVDPREIRDQLKWKELLPWAPGRTLADRQQRVEAGRNAKEYFLALVVQ